jgi:AcrR family transcriptional regulator
MKTDARVRYTKKVIQESFLKLIKEKPINKITVKSICELSEINRATFYKYYKDPIDLLDQIETELILAMRKFIETGNNENITQTLIRVLDAIKQNGELYMSLTSENGDSTFINRVIYDSYLIKKSSLNELLPNLSHQHQEWLYYFMSEGFTSVVLSWVRNGMQEEPIEVAQFFNRLNKIILKELRS